LRGGIFTWAVLDALKHGDTCDDGIIELSELAAYIQAEVPKLAAELRGEKTPRAIAPLCICCPKTKGQRLPPPSRALAHAERTSSW
jgi:hypothetical protein